jgi:SAM-dependent methyltransferase
LPAAASAPRPAHPEPTLRLHLIVLYSRLIEWVFHHHFLARILFAITDVRSRIASFLLRGEGKECPCCEGHFKSMGSRRIVSWGGVCPRCGSFTRQRAMALLFENGTLPSGKLLHFAPEPFLDPLFDRLKAKGVDRVTADLFIPADLKLDITDMDLADDSFDAIICSHVLEHVPDDKAAMSEMKRVLKPGGTLLALFPFRPDQQTYEDAAVTSPFDRMMAFGQHDHVRFYGADVLDRLRGAGFDVEDKTGADLFDAAAIDRYSLDPTEHFFICRA